MLAFETATHLAAQALQRGMSVVLDELNLDSRTFSLFLARAYQAGARVEWHNMGTSVEECKRRNAQLGHPVDDMEIERLAHEYGYLLEQK